MLRELRLVRVQERIFLYPHPVKTDLKYLIACVSDTEAMKMIESIKQGFIPHPDETGSPFQQTGLHNDGQTRILEYVQQ